MRCSVSIQSGRLTSSIVGVSLVFCTASFADAKRHLLTLSVHRGMVNETPLRYARRDAERVLKAFVDMGGVHQADTIALVDPSLEVVRTTFRALGDGRVKEGDVLVTYVSSHMDSGSIHLGSERLYFKDLFAAARSTGASLRVFILDGCRSGSVTVKGLRRTRAARMIRPMPKPASGEVVLTSTAPNEEALESQRLAGSFFTHYLVTGLRGAADRDGNGEITVDEVFRFGHDRTVYATAGSPIGAQHPSFKVDLAGSSTFVLARARWRSQSAAWFRVKRPRWGIAYLFHQSRGELEAEITLQNRGAVLVPPGAYRIRVATAQRIEEGEVFLRAGTSTELRHVKLRAVPLLSMIRKGEGSKRLWAKIHTSFEVGQASIDGFGPLLGLGIAMSLEWRLVSTGVRVSYGYATASNDHISFLLHQIGLAAEISHPVQLWSFALSFGLDGESVFLFEDLQPRRDGVETKGGRSAVKMSVAPLIRLELPLGQRWEIAASFRGRFVFGKGTSARFAPLGTLGCGWVF